MKADIIIIYIYHIFFLFPHNGVTIMAITERTILKYVTTI